MAFSARSGICCGPVELANRARESAGRLGWIRTATGPVFPPGTERRPAGSAAKFEASGRRPCRPGCAISSKPLRASLVVQRCTPSLRDLPGNASPGEAARGLSERLCQAQNSRVFVVKIWASPFGLSTFEVSGAPNWGFFTA